MVKFIEMDRVDVTSENSSSQATSINRKTEETLKRFPKIDRAQRTEKFSDVVDGLITRLSKKEDLEFGELDQAILKSKVARYFEFNQTCDANTLYDAIIETPDFLREEKGLSVTAYL